MYGPRDLRAARLDVSPVLSVDLIHLCEIGHVGKEDVHFDDMLD
jgi:hypothetical protein